VRWYGYSSGRWEGNEFVIDSTGFDGRTWLDQYGYPHSDQMKLEERYHRIDHDTIEMTVTVNDPKMYTKPWLSQKKTWSLLPKPEEYSLDGWNGLPEEVCAPIDEVDNFEGRESVTKSIRECSNKIIHAEDVRPRLCWSRLQRLVREDRVFRGFQLIRSHSQRRCAGSWYVANPKYQAVQRLHLSIPANAEVIFGLNAVRIKMVPFMVESYLPDFRQSMSCRVPTDA
jgi:hypothetical protein